MSKRRERVYALLMLALIIGSFFIPGPEEASPYNTPCATEDSMNCYWDVDLQGNGHGRSFVDIEGKVYYQ